MKKSDINIHVITESVGLQTIDMLYAWHQSQSKDFASDISVTFGPHDPNKINVLWYYRPYTVPEDIDSYDRVILCNASEALAVSSPAMKELLDRPNSYLLCNSYLTDDHSLYSKVACFPMDIFLCRNYWLNPFYPQAFLEKTPDCVQNITLINGANRSWRHHFIQEVVAVVPELTVVSNISNCIHETSQSPWEPAQDTEFREWVNNYYPVDRDQKDTYYDNSVLIGIDQKFGSIPPGYFIMDQFYQSRCILFPEAAWQNNEMTLTEKSLKCFYTGCIPWPVGGANINKLFNQLGFQTAWNLLPDHLKLFDSELDHRHRYATMAQAVKWLWDHHEVLESPRAQHMIEQNNKNFFSNSATKIMCQRLDEILGL